MCISLDCCLLLSITYTSLHNLHMYPPTHHYIPNLSIHITVLHLSMYPPTHHYIPHRTSLCIHLHTTTYSTFLSIHLHITHLPPTHHYLPIHISRVSMCRRFIVRVCNAPCKDVYANRQGSPLQGSLCMHHGYIRMLVQCKCHVPCDGPK